MNHAACTPVVHVVDDDDNFRMSIQGLLAACGHAVRGYDSAEAYLSDAPAGHGCVLLDVNMPGLSGLELQARLRAHGNGRPIIFLTGHGDIPMTVQALRAGAETVLTKPVSRNSLLEAIALALRHDLVWQEQADKERELLAAFDRLTPRELEIFERVMAGLLNKQIAYETQTAERTVKAHRSQIMHKLGTRSLPELTRLYDRYRELQARAGNPAP
ncbi:response regulator transcription factor [Telluria beijingensis]|uniref:response regulator transcription factor n=1 Tax=Telluria beijingensis TaxID=3068633 RepID=UPI0027960946|nr:response regulator [Massilia sp. REN29]